MKKRLPLFAIVILQINFLTAQKIVAVATPEAAGFSSERLQRLDKAMNEWVDKEWMTGATALIIKDGKIAYYKSVGYNDLEAKTPLQKDVIYRIASQTKAITSVAIMMLVEEGKIVLDDPVSKYISTYKNQTVLDKYNAADTTYTTVPAKRAVTIRDLLSHISGIGYAQIGSPTANAIYAKSHLTSGVGEHDESLLSAMTRLGTLPLLHQPGEKWTYGLNADLLGAIVEVVSGQSLNDFFNQRIFNPLGMKDTYFTIPAAKANRLINIYLEKNNRLIKFVGTLLGSDKAPVDYPLHLTSYFSGGAGLSSSIYDYAVFLQMLLNNGSYNGKQLLSRNTVRIMTMNQIGNLTLDNGDKFGLGFEVVPANASGRTPAQEGTYSWGGAFTTNYWVDPKEKIVMLFYRQLVNSTHGDVVEKFRNLTYQALK